ncbi:hypothetical protein Ksed_10270 [Kytococcus sedentarius DSM 20547]|uniref:SdpI/YhfL protein family n=2 Tax=Kytococcus sedentarius TaxID=1276 RepID=C7NGG4_KYTSD|nr:hypothetical protein Ksed_10270 [Kytococcus sedentarius DSM 20547]
MVEVSTDAIVMAVCTVALGAAGPFVHVMCRSAAEGKVMRNSAVGLRTRATMASDHAWEVGHRAALPVTRGAAWAVPLLAVAALALALVRGLDGFTEAAVLATGGLVGVLTVLAGVMAHRAARQANLAGGDVASPPDSQA